MAFLGPCKTQILTQDSHFYYCCIYFVTNIFSTNLYWCEFEFNLLPSLVVQLVKNLPAM